MPFTVKVAAFKIVQSILLIMLCISRKKKPRRATLWNQTCEKIKWQNKVNIISLLFFWTKVHFPCFVCVDERPWHITAPSPWLAPHRRCLSHLTVSVSPSADVPIRFILFSRYIDAAAIATVSGEECCVCVTPEKSPNYWLRLSLFISNQLLFYLSSSCSVLWNDPY